MNDRTKDKSINNHLQYLLQVIGGKWKLPILCILTKKEVVRFNELKNVNEKELLILSNSFFAYHLEKSFVVS